MLLLDTNILVHAFRREAHEHAQFHRLVAEMVAGESAYAVSDFVVNGFLRIVTNGRIFKNPDPLDSAMSFAEDVRNRPHAVVVVPGQRHWEIFSRLCHQIEAKGKLVPDAYLAALAIEHGCEFVTCDKDFARFEGLRWRSPLN
ncbi:type II toxin-antitoxin system VapC family toxin [Nonomuraea sp. NPDC050394]|uniref:type II toxin-antitoxin system VapC family toxin n=1 Tax=Nonomuraea sp. NPDC050394 TaxID=3364363 RepID=UPI0037B03001